MKITDCILCEDIRHEIDNKQSLMGIFGDKILVRVPAEIKEKQQVTIRLGIFVRLLFEEVDWQQKVQQLELMILYAGNSKSLGKGPIKLKKDEFFNKMAVLSAIINNFPVTENGEIQIMVNLFDAKGVKISSSPANQPVKIELGPSGEK